MTATHTIIAPASAIGGGVAIVRLSGALSREAFMKLTGLKSPEPRQAQLVSLKTPSGKLLDKAVALYFAAPNSYTGEDVLELHVHGGRAVVQGVIDTVLSLDKSFRLATGGEFTKRAVLNGKLDLTEAEAVADLVAAETEAQKELALAQMGGALKNLYEDWRARLLNLLAHMEASIDFVDEEDVPADLLRDIDEKIGVILNEINHHLDDQSLGERLRDGFTIAVIGAPNAGKSSLVNALAKRDVAIVSDIAGTTRDALEVHLNLGGYPVILVDTAGLRETSDSIESEGIRRAKFRAQNADLVLALFDATVKQDKETLSAVDARTLTVFTKSDLAKSGGLSVSVTQNENLDRLVDEMTARIAKLAAPKSSAPLLTRTRHRENVTETQAHLHRAVENASPELKTEDMRLAVRALGRLTGRVDVEDLLDVIFRDFCIGK
jgi:tRNA modification GTPase